MNTQTNNAGCVPAAKFTRKIVALSNTKSGKPLTGKQLEKKLKSAARKETNEAGRIMAREAKGELYNLRTLRFVLQNSPNLQEFVSTWLSALSKETGKAITLKDVLNVPVPAYLDYVKDVEAARGLSRSGITPTEFKDVMNRYFRGELCKRVDSSAAPVLCAAWQRSADVIGA